MTLRFSIIIPTLNRRQMLGEALTSVRSQLWRDVEIIVVDGGSTDGTIEELRSQSDIRLVEGPDRGLYDALNKGIACADGEIIGLLNSDDLYSPGTFAAVAAAFRTGVHAVCGTALVIAEDQVLATFDNAADKALTSARTALIGACTINARFIRRDAMARIGPFTLDYTYVSDRDWLTRWHEAGLATATINDVVLRYRQHAGSLTFDADRRRELPIREDLLRLARRWRDDPFAHPETRRIAALLEGRCVATLAVVALCKGNLAELGQRLFVDQGQRSIAPFVSIIRGGIDWVVQIPKRWKSSPTARASTAVST